MACMVCVNDKLIRILSLKLRNPLRADSFNYQAGTALDYNKWQEESFQQQAVNIMNEQCSPECL